MHAIYLSVYLYHNSALKFPFSQRQDLLELSIKNKFKDISFNIKESDNITCYNVYIKAVKINEYKKYTFYSSQGKCILFKDVKMLKDNVEVTHCVQTFISKDAKNHSGVPTINCHLLAWCTFTWPYLSVCIKRTACIQFCKHVQVVYMQFSFSICYHILYDCMLYFPITRLV